MGRVLILLFCLVAATGVCSVEIIESELSSLPKLFHLDDYHKCLAKKDGVFCVGEFELYTEEPDHSTFNLIKKYNHVPYLYNRTFVHRGYCLPERCAGAGRNASARFERCVDTWARSRHGLQARLRHLHYCQKHGERASNAPDTSDLAHRAFLYVVYFLLFMNAVGTIYDLYVEEKDRKYPNLCLWSVRRNWKRLTASTEHLDRSLRFFEPMNGVKVLLITGAVYAHVGVLASKMYQKDPRVMENVAYNSGPILGALTTVTQAFVTMANYLLAYHILRYAKQYNIGFHMLPVLILKRLLRMLPVYLLLIGFSATWWSSMGEGPVWPLIVNHESSICRRKFWYIASFLQNFFEPQHICLVQTWIYSVDVQLHVLALIVCLFAIKYSRYAFHIMFSTLIAAIATTVYVVFKNQYEPAFYSLMMPENFRTMFQNDKTFVGLYIMPTNCMISAATGLFMGYFNLEMEQNKKPKRFLGLHQFAIPVVIALAYSAFYVREMIEDPVVVTSMLIVERLVISVVAIILLNAVEERSTTINLLRWPALHPFARLSMCVSMVHWCVNAYLLGTRTMLQDYSTVGLVLETVGTWFISYLLAVPLIILVEYPVQKHLEKLLTG